MPIRSFDHVAVPIENTDAMLAFYRALGFGVNERESFYSVHFGDRKVNFHAPERWKSGSLRLGAFCESLRAMLDQAGAKIIEGPVEQQGGRDRGRAKSTSLYLRDSNSNFLEFMVYSDN